MSSHTVFINVHCNIIKSVQSVCSRLRQHFVTFTLQVISPSTNPQVRVPPLLVSPRLLIQYIRRHPPHLRDLFLQMQSKDMPTGPTCQGEYRTLAAVFWPTKRRTLAVVRWTESWMEVLSILANKQTSGLLTWITWHQISKSQFYLQQFNVTL